MNVKSVEKENGKAKVVVEIDKPEFEQALNKAYAKCRKDIMLPGFRKGKAPRKMVESMYGATVFYEDAVNEIFPEIYTTAIVDQQLKAVGSPSVSNMDTPDEGGVFPTSPRLSALLELCYQKGKLPFDLGGFLGGESKAVTMEAILRGIEG